MPTPVGVFVDLRSAFRSASASVWVLTTAHSSAPVGFTAISVVSVSLDPALVSFNISKTSSSLTAFFESRTFAAHLLAHDQEHVARTFSGPAAQRFAGAAAWSWSADGLPELAGAASRLSGRIASFVDAGDSLVVIGQVTSTTSADRVPLVHRDRTYAPAALPLPAA